MNERMLEGVRSGKGMREVALNPLQYRVLLFEATDGGYLFWDSSFAKAAGARYPEDARIRASVESRCLGGGSSGLCEVARPFITESSIEYEKA